ncbi:MAG: hypothetical protein PHV97_07820 [Candidatus Omnitrophica bacterium]|nr:hypothetical protein [Candidatus Omnitrophota bacterium]
MKEKMIYGFLVAFLVALMGAPALYAGENIQEVSDQEISDQTAEDESDPSAFEGDTDSMPGERAPENLPMDDAPADDGVGVGI